MFHCTRDWKSRVHAMDRFGVWCQGYRQVFCLARLLSVSITVPCSCILSRGQTWTLPLAEGMQMMNSFLHDNLIHEGFAVMT